MQRLLAVLLIDAFVGVVERRAVVVAILNQGRRAIQPAHGVVFPPRQMRQGVFHCPLASTAASACHLLIAEIGKSRVEAIIGHLDRLQQRRFVW